MYRVRGLFFSWSQSLDHVLDPLAAAVPRVEDDRFDGAFRLRQQHHQVDRQVQDEGAEEAQGHPDEPHSGHLADGREFGVAAAAHGAADLKRVMVLQGLAQRGDQQDAVRPQPRFVRERKQPDEGRAQQVHERRHEDGERETHVHQFARQDLRVVVVALPQLFAQQHQGCGGRGEAGHQEEVGDGTRRLIRRVSSDPHAAVGRILSSHAGPPERFVGGRGSGVL